MTDPETLLGDRLAAAFAAVVGERVDPVVRRSQHADFQADGALPLAGRLRRAPRDIAADVLAAADLDDLVTGAEVSGPGFVNLTVRAELLGGLLATLAGDDRLGVPVAVPPEIVTVDYSAPNVAKEMHVGHLRSTIIGDAVARLYTWLGHDVVRCNHLGDWGTPFGMLIEHLLDLGEDAAAHELSVGDLNSFYQAARAKFDAQPQFADRARQRVVALQRGDEPTLRLWRMLVAESQRYFLAVYDRLDVTLSEVDFSGESRYNPMLPAVVDDLDRLGLLRESDGARCVFPAGFAGRDGEPLPVIVQKSDGGFGYAATDLAAVRHRVDDLRADRLLYVVGLPQRQHFAMVFATAAAAGWLGEHATASHVGFGSVLGADGKKFATRAGAAPKLVDLLDEAVARADAVVREKNPDLDDAARARVARAVGIGAVKYADLSTDRVKDYVFDYDRMLALDGNTAPYLQYAYARIRSIFHRGNVTAPPVVATVQVAEPAERQLALQLLAFASVVAIVAETLEFHRLAAYLYALAKAFSGFFESCPVLRAADPATRDSRLVLCDLTARTLHQGLDLLGITTLDRM